jgi:hypothetical protein
VLDVLAGQSMQQHEGDVVQPMHVDLGGEGIAIPHILLGDQHQLKLVGQSCATAHCDSQQAPASGLLLTMRHSTT